MIARQGVWWTVLCFWVVVFFPRWYFITYTKVWELRQLVAKSYFEQMRVLHSAEMDIMTDIASFVRYTDAVIIVPPPGTYPLLSSSPLWRAALGSSQQLASPLLFTKATKTVIALVPGKNRLWQPTSAVCQQGGCATLNWPVAEVVYWEVP